MGMQLVIELPIFVKRAERLFTEIELRSLVDTIAFNPFVGDEIPGTGGVRKLRFAAKQKGKRGGARVSDLLRLRRGNPIYLLTCYGKNEAEDLTDSQRQTMRAFAQAIKTAARERK